MSQPNMASGRASQEAQPEFGWKGLLLMLMAVGIIVVVVGRSLWLHCTADKEDHHVVPNLH